MRARANPFRSERIDNLSYQFETGSLEQLIAVIEERNFRGAIVGPKGTGKTTLFKDLFNELQKRRFSVALLRFQDDGSRANLMRFREATQSLHSKHILLLDSAGLLTWWDWRHVKAESQKLRGLIITCHRPGRMPTLHTCRSTPQQLIGFAESLAGEEACSEKKLEQLFQRNRGNFRECFRELYDQFSDDLILGATKNETPC
ncbi:AAA family ATPase [Thalassoglobus sp. JC818]|uniref:ATP-binding protein n=1 Tax=Thalassoglobus sp. JC818 TaxID=3232136 RepID=UPI00345902A0